MFSLYPSHPSSYSHHQHHSNRHSLFHQVPPTSALSAQLARNELERQYFSKLAASERKKQRKITGKAALLKSFGKIMDQLVDEEGSEVEEVEEQLNAFNLHKPLSPFARQPSWRQSQAAQRRQRQHAYHQQEQQLLKAQRQREAFEAQLRQQQLETQHAREASLIKARLHDEYLAYVETVIEHKRKAEEVERKKKRRALIKAEVTKDRAIEVCQQQQQRDPEAFYFVRRSKISTPSPPFMQTQPIFAYPPAASKPADSPAFQIAALEARLHKLIAEFAFPDMLEFTSAASSSEREVPALTFNHTNASFHTYEAALTSLLTDADSVESNGIDEVRRLRKNFVKKVEETLELLEARKKDVWEKLKWAQKVSSPASAPASVEVVGSVVPVVVPTAKLASVPAPASVSIPITSEPEEGDTTSTPVVSQAPPTPPIEVAESVIDGGSLPAPSAPAFGEVPVSGTSFTSRSPSHSLARPASVKDEEEEDSDVEYVFGDKVTIKEDGFEAVNNRSF